MFKFSILAYQNKDKESDGKHPGYSRLTTERSLKHKFGALISFIGMKYSADNKRLKRKGT